MVEYIERKKEVSTMRPVKILTDSCSDLPRELREKYDIDYARMKTDRDGVEQWASLDFEYYTPKELYDPIRAGKRVLTTQVPPEEFDRIFRQYLSQGYDIVYIGCSLKQSSSVNTGEKCLARRVRVAHNSLRVASAITVDVLDCLGHVRAAEYRDAGFSAQDITEKIKAERNNVNEYVTVHNLDALKRAGRVKASSAFFGNLLGVKPILISDVEGYQTPVKKVKGRQNSLREMVNMMKDSIVDPRKQCIYIVHSDCAEEAEVLRQMVQEAIPDASTYIGPIIGASIGADALGIFAFGREVTYKA